MNTDKLFHFVTSHGSTNGSVEGWTAGGIAAILYPGWISHQHCPGHHLERSPQQLLWNLLRPPRQCHYGQCSCLYICQDHPQHLCQLCFPESELCIKYKAKPKSSFTGPVWSGFTILPCLYSSVLDNCTYFTSNIVCYFLVRKSKQNFRIKEYI